MPFNAWVDHWKSHISEAWNGGGECAFEQNGNYWIHRGTGFTVWSL